MKQWALFVITILRYGKLFQPLKLDEEIQSWKRLLLRIPILCQVISIIALYQQNKKWPHQVYHWTEKRLAFVSVYKNASTTVLASLLDAQNTDMSFVKMSTIDVHSFSKRFMRTHINNDYDCFTIVRDPYDRLLSCYNDQVLNRNGKDHFKSLYFGLLHESLTFEQFLNRVNRIPDAIKEPHFRKQTHNIPENNCLKIFRIENFDTEVIPFLNSYGVSVSSKNRTHKTNSQIEKNDLKAFVKQTYKEDYLRFNYS